MPGSKIHAYMDKLLLGRSYWKVHREMDKAVRSMGRRHRALYHDPASAYAIACKLYPGDYGAVLAAQYHIILDRICSRDPAFRELLVASAALSRLKKRRRKPS